MPKPQLTKPERNLFIVIALFIALIGGGGGYWEWINEDPVISIPPEPTLPSPNAFDIYLEAQQALSLRDPVLARSFHGNRPSGRGAANHVPLKVRLKEITNQPSTMSLLHQALSTPYAEPREMMLSEVPHYRHSRLQMYVGLFDYLEALIRTYRDAGDEEMVVTTCDLYLDICEQAEQNGWVVSLDQSDSRYKLICPVLWEIKSDLSRQHLLTMKNRLGKYITQPDRTVDYLQNRIHLHEFKILRSFQTTGWRTEGGYYLRYRIDTRVPYLDNERQAMAVFENDAKAILHRASLPFNDPTPWPKTDERSLIRAINQERLNIAMSLARRTHAQLMYVAYALELYTRDHGAYPKTLADLSPKYITRVPDDPFATAGTFVYRISGSGYQLYSVGIDGIDDGGKPVIFDTLYRSTSGDVIAGSKVFY